MSRPEGPSDRLQELIDLVADGHAGEAEFAALQEQLRDDAAARRLYLEAMELHASLRKSRLPAMRSTAAKGAVDPVPSTFPRGTEGRELPHARSSPGRPAWSHWRRDHLGWAAAAVAAVLLVAVSVRLWLGADRPQGEAREAVATVVASEGVRWSGLAGSAPGVGSALSVGQSLRLEQGTVGLRFGRDARVTLEGPAEFGVLSAMRLRATQGKVTIRVGPDSRGFTVETPRAEVVDLGTEFGLEINKAGRTDVVVFQGAVDLSYETNPDAATNRGQSRRLIQGEALRLGSDGDMSRIVSVERRPGDGHWSTDSANREDGVIEGIGDDIRGLGSTKYYQIVPRGLFEDVPAYVDRPHQWNGLDRRGLPEPLLGADYVMPFNVDKRSRDIQITVTVARAATLYVFFDDRAEVPYWLAEQFDDTGWDIGLDEGPSPERDLTTDTGPGRSVDTVFSVWKRELDDAATVTLGPMVDVRPGKAMYGIAARARRSD